LKMGCAGSKSTNVTEVEGPTVPPPVKAAPVPSAKPVEAPTTKKEAEVDAKPAELSQSVTWAERQWKKATDASQVDLTAIDLAIEDGENRALAQDVTAAAIKVALAANFIDNEAAIGRYLAEIVIKVALDNEVAGMTALANQVTALAIEDALASAEESPHELGGKVAAAAIEASLTNVELGDKVAAAAIAAALSDTPSTPPKSPPLKSPSVIARDVVAAAISSAEEETAAAKARKLKDGEQASPSVKQGEGEEERGLWNLVARAFFGKE